MKLNQYINPILPWNQQENDPQHDFQHHHYHYNMHLLTLEYSSFNTEG